jgi:lipopolysaccharide transport system permease protein
MHHLSEFFGLNKKFLIYNLIIRNLKIKYRRSFFGMFWTVLIPAASALVYFVVFQFVMRVQIENYLLHIMAGLVPWTFLATSVVNSIDSLVGNHHLLNKVPLPTQSLPLAEVLTQFLNLLLSLPIVFVLMIATSSFAGWHIFQYLFLCGLLFLMVYSFSLLVAIGFVYLRDLKFLMTIVLQFWFYLTPIMYTTQMIPEKFKFLLWLNPVGLIFEGFQLSLISHQWLSLNSLFIIFTQILMFLGFAFLLNRRLKSNLVEML